MCKDCNRNTDLWMCLICGNIGCGRYAKAHAYKYVFLNIISFY